MAKTLAKVFGALFILLGLLGFIPNGLIGGGLILTNVNHDLVHLLSGIILLIAARSTNAGTAKTLLVVGVVYLLVTILGFMAVDVTGTGSIFGLLAVNNAGNYLHLILAIIFIWGGVCGKKDNLGQSA